MSSIVDWHPFFKVCTYREPARMVTCVPFLVTSSSSWLDLNDLLDKEFHGHIASCMRLWDIVTTIASRYLRCDIFAHDSTNDWLTCVNISLILSWSQRTGNRWFIRYQSWTSWRSLERAFTASTWDVNGKRIKLCPTYDRAYPKREADTIRNQKWAGVLCICGKYR